MGAFVRGDVCNQSLIYSGTAKSVKLSSSQGYSEGDDKSELTGVAPYVRKARKPNTNKSKPNMSKSKQSISTSNPSTSKSKPTMSR